MICVLELYVGDYEDPKLLCERKFDNWAMQWERLWQGC